MTNRYRVSGLAFCALLLAAASAMAQQPITYQGQLKQSGTPFTGTPDLEFRLYDSISGGSQIGSAIVRDEWPVEDGLFQVELDFGAGAFGPDPRWLEIVVDGTALSPRQAVSPTPVALFALDSAGGGTASVWSVNGSATYYDGGNVGVGFVNPPAPLTVRSAGRYAPFINNGFGDFYIGDGNVGLSIGVALQGGGTGVSRLWTNGGENRIKLGSAAFGDVLTVVGDRVGIGTGNTVPSADLDVDGSARIRALQHAQSEPRNLVVDSSGTVALAPVRTITLPASSFRAESSSIETLVNFGWISVGDAVFVRLFAPVALPSGARIESISAVALDNLANVDLQFDLIEHPLADGPPGQTIASWKTSGASTSLQQLTATDLAATIAASDNQYYISVEPRTEFGTGGWGSVLDLRVYAVSIDYRI